MSPIKKYKLILLFIFLFSSIGLISAQDLLEELKNEYTPAPQYTQATFKTTRISFGQSVEIRKKNIFEFSVMNSFWNIPNSNTQSFVADRLSARIGINYSISDRLNIGIGGTTFDGIFDTFLKYRLVRQRQDHSKTPISITLFQNASYRSKPFNNISQFDNFSDRLAFTTQVLIARKFTSNFSFQVSPTFIHRTSSTFEEDPNNQFAIGFGARYKLGGHVAIVSEYYYNTTRLESIDTFDAFAIGVNWELSDLILQFSLSNTRNFVEDTFITQTGNNFNFNDGNLHFRFQAVYVLHLSRKSPKKK